MNRRRLVVASCLLSIFALRSAANAATLPVDAKDSASVRPQINTFLTTEIKALGGEDLAAVSAARSAIVAEVIPGPPTQPQPTSAFYNAFSEVLATQIDPLIKSSDPRVRLNAAIVVARVAERVNNSTLAPAVILLLGDKVDAVAHWGVKGARYVLAPLLGNVVLARNAQLLQELAKTVASRIKDPSIVATAYDALDNGANAVPQTQFNAVLPPVVDLVQSILEQRLALYQQGEPPSPEIDQLAVNFLVRERIWKAPTPNQAAQQQRTVQLMVDLISSAAQRAPAASGNEHASVADILKKGGLGFQVVGSLVGNDGLVDAGKKLGSINSANNADLGPRTTAVIDAVMKIPQFAGTKAPMTLPATTPSSAPTTEP